MIISLDAMGGDFGPEVVIGGAAIALMRKPHLRFAIFGEEEKVLPIIAQYPKVQAVSEFHNCEISISMNDKPSTALRRGRWKSGMWKAVEAVKHGEASACISAGNTGALMAMSKFCLRTLPGIDRPAMSAIWPTLKGESIVLDVGASIGASASQLVEFAIMGSAMVRALSEIKQPSVGLLNIGVEEVKGLDNVRSAGKILRDIKFDSMQYHGFVEGNDIGVGTVDVVVTEGFSGNIALKTAEGTAKQITQHLAAAINRTLLAKIGYVLAKGAFSFLREKLDPRNSNGAVLLGLNGVVIKSHGATDQEGFAAAVEMGHDMAANGLLEKISRDLQFFSTRKELE